MSILHPSSGQGLGRAASQEGYSVGVRWLETQGVRWSGGPPGASPAPSSPKLASWLMQTKSLAPPPRLTPRRTLFLPTNVRRCVALTPSALSVGLRPILWQGECTALERWAGLGLDLGIGPCSPCCCWPGRVSPSAILGALGQVPGHLGPQAPPPLAT